MKEAIVGYRYFFPKSWMLLLICIGYPALGLAGASLFGTSFFGIMAVQFAAFYVTGAEMIINKVSFAGLTAKDSRYLEYLMTSTKGMDLLKHILLVEQLRRIITTIVIMGGVGLIVQRSNEEFYIGFGNVVVLFLVASIVQELLVYMMRCYINPNLYFATIIFCYMLLGVGMSIMFIDLKVIGYVILVGLYVFMLIMERGMLLKRARRSYYDERI